MQDYEKLQAIESLRAIVKPGDTVYTILRHVSSSGMTRHISVIVIGDDKKPMMLDYLITKVLGYKRVPMNKGEGVIVGGAGMDMGYHLVYNLSRALFADTFECIGDNCPANDHVNGDNNRKPHKHSDGGYALRHEWL